MSEYQFLLFYVYQPIPNCSYLTDFFERICTELQIRGRIRVSMEGSNGIISGTLLAIQKFKMDVIRQLENFPFHWYQSGLVETLPREIQLFDSLSVKITKEVVSLDLKEDIMKDVIEASSGKFLSPQQFHSYLSQMENQSGNPSDIKLIDIRNQYEVRIGKFMGKTFEAINPETRKFSDIVNYFDNHIDELKGKTVLMYCTGGVRCERASAYLKYKGITDVYQLEGGIHAYQTAFGEDGYFRGKNFVFDPRIAISNTEASRFNKVMIDPIHSDSNSNSNNSIEQGDNMNLYEEKKLNRNYSQPHDKSMDSACRDTKVQSIGHCLVCGDIWDDYSAHQRCSDCRLLLLLCNTCISTDEISSHKHLLKCELCFKRKNSSK